MPAPRTATATAPPVHGGNLYVGPSLTRSLAGLLLALGTQAAAASRS